MNMKAKPGLQAILKQIASIQEMERGKLCPMRAGAYYNHQSWEEGRNVVRYVPHQLKAGLQKAIAGYQQYLKLTKAYANEIVRRTRQRQTAKLSALPTRKRAKSQ
jgi:hypothetical protein